MTSEPAGSGSAISRAAWGGWWLLSVFVLALGVLFFLAASGRPGSVVAVAFALYVAVATLLVQRQYLGWIAGGTAQPPWRFGTALFAVGLAGVGLGYWMLRPTMDPSEARDNGDIVLLGGVLLVYLGAGLVIMSLRGLVARSREMPRRVVLACVGAVALMVALAGLGLWTLGEWPTKVSLLLVAPLLLVPGVIGVLSEAAIRSLSAGGRVSSRARLLVVAGVVLLLVVAVWLLFAAREESRLLALLVVLVLAVLTVALASSTFADIAVVLAAVALLGVTPAPQEGLPEPTEASEHVLVAIGDSYMSGEGAEAYIGGTDQGRGGNECRRSRSAWAAQVGLRSPFDGLIFLACSGARSYNVWTSGSPAPDPQAGETATQLKQYADYKERIPGLVPALVVVSLGGNDAGFADIGTTCLLGGDCNDAEPARLKDPANLGRVERRLDRTYAEIRETFEGSPVVVVPYPDPFDDEAPCAGVPLGEGDVDLIDELLPKLNDVVEGVADKYGFHYAADMEDALAVENRQLCSGGEGRRPGLNFVALRSVQGLQGQRFNPEEWYHNSLHPNELGHESLERAFLRWLDAESGGEGVAALESPEELVPADPTPVDVPDEAPVDAEEGGEDCSDDPSDYTREDPSGCHRAAVMWAVGKSGEDLVKASPLLGATTVGAWLLSICLFAWRRAAAEQRAAARAAATANPSD